MKRNGKTLPTLRDGHPRRMSDARNAWRKMSDAQRLAILEFQRQDFTIVCADSGCMAFVTDSEPRFVLNSEEP